jgi:hypothetical protein
MKPVICIHQVGKVGSTSVLKTLSRFLPGEKIHQTHSLSERVMLDSILRWLDRSRRSPGFRPSPNLLSSIEISGYLQHGLAQRDWYLLSLVRDPIGRNVSAFFQNLHLIWVHHLPGDLREICSRLLRKEAGSMPSEDEIREVAKSLVELFHKQYFPRFLDRWFDDEMRGVFGLDVFSERFQRDRGYQLYRSDRVRLLLLRIEDIADALEPGLRAWLSGSPWEHPSGSGCDLELKRANVAENKRYALLYRLFMEQLTFDPALVEQEYTSRAARHFYSDVERESLAARWTKTEIAPQTAPSIA